jgi:hypothetical protein
MTARQKTSVGEFGGVIYQFNRYEDSGLLEMGRYTGAVRDFTFSVRFDFVRDFSQCSLVAVGLHGAGLLGQRVLEYQRDFPQFHTQPVFQLVPVESSIRFD